MSSPRPAPPLPFHSFPAPLPTASRVRTDPDPQHTLNLLQCICKSCSRVLLPDYERKQQLKKMRSPRTDVLGKAALFKRALDRCKKTKQCPYCHRPNGTVKKVHGAPTLKIVHERYKGRQNEGEAEDLLQSLQGALHANPEVAHALKVAVENLLPTRVLELFRAMTDEDCEVLWVSPLIGRPENLVLEHILVPPVPIRPSVAMDVGGGSNEDDLTVKLLEIINVNLALEVNMTKNPQTKTIMEGWDVLQSQVAQYSGERRSSSVVLHCVSCFHLNEWPHS